MTCNDTYNKDAHILHVMGVVYEAGLGPSLWPDCCSLGYPLARPT